MGLILTTEQDYNSIRGALGLDFDVRRQLTDDVIDELTFLPMAEAEAVSRLQNNDYTTLAQLPPTDYNKLAFKAGTVALTCSNLCNRLQITIPTIQKIDDIGETQRVTIDWLGKKDSFRSDANYFFDLVNGTYLPKAFPVALAVAKGRVLRHDPDYYRSYTNQVVSNVVGYTSPNGNIYQISVV